MIETAVYTSIGGRAENEDTVRLLRKGSGVCALVADGLGGHGGGRQASSLAAQVLENGWDGSADPEVLARLLQQAHRQIQAIQTPLCKMKTTAVVLALAPGRSAWAHAGDSRLYRFRDGKLEFQTRDHSASQIAVMLGDITPAEIRFHEDRSKVFRALGQEGDLNVDTGEAAAGPEFQAWLLCSDGFWEYVLESEMEKDLSLSGSPEEWLERMAARQRAKAPLDCDNNSAAAVWLR